MGERIAELTPLIAGYRQFYDRYFCDNKELYEQLSRVGQSPKSLVIACCDSRVDPALLFQCGPGDLFVVRSVANLVPPYQDKGLSCSTGAAIEFAICHLGIEHAIVLGHSQCAGVKALCEMQGANESSGMVGAWMRIAEKARHEVFPKPPQTPVTPEQVEACSHASLLHSYHHLFTYPWLSKAVLAGRLQCHAWFFNVATGILEAYDFDQESFVSLLSENAVMSSI